MGEASAYPRILLLTFAVLLLGCLAGTPELVAASYPDFDGDGDVDQTDFGHLQECFTDAGVAQNDPRCLDARLAGKADVGLIDFAIFQACMSGPGIAAGIECSPPQVYLLPDFDNDGDVDQSDFGHLQACFTDPGVVQDDPGCQDAKLAGHDVIGVEDLVILQGCMTGPGIPAGPGCTASPPAGLPDFDGDGDVDQSDFGHLQSCLTDPGVPQDDPNCQDARLASHEDVGVEDLIIFRGCMTGPDLPAAPRCTPSPSQCTISGRVTADTGEAISGVVMTGLGGNPNTDANGEYVVRVPFGFSGSAVPSQKCYGFFPLARSYRNLFTNRMNQDFVGSATSPATTYFVATNDPIASDDNPGTEALPWKTLARAASACVGDTVLVKEGTYDEHFVPQYSGTAAAPITFKAYPGEVATIARGVSILVAGYVRIEGFDITSPTTDGPGIAIQCSCSTTVCRGVQIINNHIHDCLGPGVGRGVDAHSVSDLLIEGNEINNNRGTAIFLDGMHSAVNNVNIVIRNNYIHYNGQDGIHPEGQQILIENNRIGNQYHTDGHQDAIEVYGPMDGLTIRNNLIWDTTQNIYLSAENSYIRNVSVVGNVVWTQDYTGQSVAGFNIGPNIADITNLRIEGNTFANSWCMVTNSFAQKPEHWITGLSISNNIFYRSRLDVAVAADFPTDYNVFYNPEREIMSWNGTWVTDLAAFQAAYPTKQQNSIQADPLFSDATGYDFRLSAGSPAVNTGAPVTDLTVDPDGVSRPQGAEFDVGAYELPQ